MPPSVGAKRKRGDRTYSDEQQYSRPSPHRPGNLPLAQQSQSSSPANDRDLTPARGRGGRRLSRGGRGASNAPSPMSSPASATANANANANANTNANTNGTAHDTTHGTAERGQTDVDSATMTLQAPYPPNHVFADPPANRYSYHYQHLPDAVCQSWHTGGSDDARRRAWEALQEEDGATLTEFLQELIYTVVYARLSPADAGSLVQQLCQGEPSAPAPDTVALQTSLLDATSIVFDGNPDLPLDRLSAFLFHSGIAPELLRLELDAGLLEKLDLIRNTFSRMGIRKQTNILYRQANFNLLREESEGFAKLMTELFTTSGSEPPTGDIVENTVEKVKAMIGAFDLDVGRSLDVVLDVFGAVLVKQFRFFVKFLRASPWWPRVAGQPKSTSSLTGLPLWALPGMPDWHLTDDQRQLVATQTLARDQAFWPEARKTGLQAFYHLGKATPAQDKIHQTSPATDPNLEGTAAPMGNRDAAQLLGFKLRFYSSSPARDESDVLPDNLIYLSALLIKIGFISLDDLYPHIWRTDDAMDEFKQQKLKEKAERERAARPGAGAKNALLMAGALADDTLPIPARLKEPTTRASTPARDPDADKASVKDSTEPADQKALLLKSLLAIGALPEALFIIGRFPWLIELLPDLPEYIHRILHYCLSKVYGDVQPLADRPSLQHQEPTYETDLPGLQKGQVKLVDPPERKILRWALLDRNDSADGTDYRFYWDEWHDNIPVCQSVDDVFTLCETLLPLVGVKIGQDPALLLKLARIGKHSLGVDPSEANRTRWLNLTKRTLLPALSLTKSNAGVVNEVFELISRYPVSVRYLMYLEWSTGRTSRNPDIKVAFDQARAETKDILKRISNTNVRPMARALAKVAFANPHIVITTALTQIEVYDSIAEVFVEGARYFTDLGYDVLTWAIVSSMAKAGRSRTQEGGIFTSRWLSALAQFAGKIYKRYGMMRPGPILQYVSEQLEGGNTTDLKMLEQMVVSMAGIATDTSYNDAQLQAMGGGPLLQSQTILQLLDRRHDSKRTSERLMKSLQDTGLAAKFLIAMAQQRQSVVYKDGDVPLKAIGNTYDEVQRVMVQYLDLLRANLTPDDFRATIPDVVGLLLDYELRPEIAFWISRPLISKQMQEFDKDNPQDQRAEEVPEPKTVSADVEMSDQINDGSEEDGEATETDDAGGDALEPDVSEAVGTALDLEANGKTPAALADEPAECWHPVMKGIMVSIEQSLPAEVVEVIGTGFYATFWQLSLYDITIPGKSYEDELSRQHKKIAAIAADRSDVSISGTKKKELAKRDISELVDRLLAENKQHLKSFQESKARLQREKEQWFQGKARMDRQLNTALMEHCFLPRILSSPLDAYFCFKFVKFLHGAGTPNFRTLGFYDLFFRSSRLTSLIFICTSKEADNLGRFLNEILKDLARWHTSRPIYEREGWGSKKTLPGFAMKVESGKVISLLDYESFRRVLFKWHGNVFGALQKCLTSPEYMHVRNAISVLRAVSGVYPAVNIHGTGLQKTVDKLRESDKEDLKVSSQALLGALHRREKLWVDVENFRQGQTKAGGPEQKAPQAAAPTSKDVPQPSSTPAKRSAETDVKDTIMSDDSYKDVKAPVGPPKVEVPSMPQVAAVPSNPPPRPASQQVAQLETSNGASTPTRSNTDTVTTTNRESRPARSESSRPSGPPRRASPPPLRPLPASLPNRPDVSDPRDTRNGYRDSPRLPARPPTEVPRAGADVRSGHNKDLRTGYRGADPAFDDYERSSRRFDRPDLIPHSSRDDRGFGREHERNAPYDRSHAIDRDRPSSIRAAPPERERDTRDGRDGPTLRARPVPSETVIAETQHSHKRDAPPQVGPAPMNPARAALMDRSADSRSHGTARGHGPDRPSRSSRPSSPRRDDERRSYPRRDVDEKRGSPGPGPVPRSEAPAPALTPAPRPSSYSNVPDHGPPRSGAAGVSMRDGRLEREPAPRPATTATPEPSSSSSARPPTSSDVPPRTTPINTQAPPISQAERPTPTGPARRHGRMISYNDPPSGNNAEPAGIHPSRLNQIDTANEPTRPSGVVHAPDPNQPPTGPRCAGPQTALSGPSPTSRGPPSVPQGADINLRAGRSNRHPLAAVNNTLAQAGTNIRGRGAMRQSSGTFASHMAPPGGPSGPPNSNGYPQHDLFASPNPNDVPLSNRPPVARPENSRDRPGDHGEERVPERRSSRHVPRSDDSRGEREHRSDRDSREGRDDRHGPSDGSRREDRSKEAFPRESGDRRGGYSRSGPPRDDAPSSRKHGRGEEPGPYGSGGYAGGRGGSRIASENKRPRRGTGM